MLNIIHETYKWEDQVTNRVCWLQEQGYNTEYRFDNLIGRWVLRATKRY